MSSSISSSDDRAYRRFAGGLLALVLLPAALLFAWAIQLGPLTGDLTRVGAHAESDYGWNGEQRVYPQALYTYAEAYDKPHDIVVLGDSFSHAMPQYQWQNGLVEHMGKSVLTLSIHDNPLATLVDSPAYRDHPPAVVVLQIVERQLPTLLAQQTSCNARAKAVPRPAPLAWKDRTPATPIARVPVTRVTAWSGWDAVRAEFAGRHLVYGALRRWADVDVSDAPAFALQRDDLFSNARSGSVLVYRNDIRKIAEWDGATIEGLACLAQSARASVERNGFTRFVLMVPPDKLTVYAGFLARDDYRQSSRLAALAERLPGVVPRLDLALQQAGAAGVKDLYLPNNTHWGITGHDTVAQAMQQFLTAPAAD